MTHATTASWGSFNNIISVQMTCTCGHIFADLPFMKCASDWWNYGSLIVCTHAKRTFRCIGN